MKQALLQMKVGGLSIVIAEQFVVVRLSRNEFRIGELGGDWLMHGTADEVLQRANQQ